MAEGETSLKKRVTPTKGVQTMRRRMMLQLGFLEREGCIRLDQVWNSPSNAEMNQVYLAASDEMAGLKGAPTYRSRTGPM
jgi:hypothetical protein